LGKTSTVRLRVGGGKKKRCEGGKKKNNVWDGPSCFPHLEEDKGRRERKGEVGSIRGKKGEMDRRTRREGKRKNARGGRGNQSLMCSNHKVECVKGVRWKRNP